MSTYKFEYESNKKNQISLTQSFTASSNLWLEQCHNNKFGNIACNPTATPEFLSSITEAPSHAKTINFICRKSWLKKSIFIRASYKRIRNTLSSCAIR